MRLTRTRFAFLAALTFVSGLAFARAQDGDAAKVIALGRTDSHVMDHLDHLTNRIGPRLTGSEGFKNACNWAREQFEKFGLQNCHLEQWGEFPVGFNRGPAWGQMVAPEKKELHFATNAWTAGTKGPVTAVTVIAPTNEEELALLRPKLKGAWVLVVAPPPQPADRRRMAPSGTANASGSGGSNESVAINIAAAGSSSGSASDSSAAAASGSRSSNASGTSGAAPGASETAAVEARAQSAASGERPAQGPRDRQGAAADRAFRDKLEKVYEEEGIAGTIRSGRNDLVLTGGSSKVSFDKLPTRPSITLLAAEHKDIADRLKAGEEVRLEFDIRNWFVEGPIALSNVIAEIPGSEKPDEVVIVSGHLDSWDGATGATDNGTGVATTMEAARLLVKAGVHPKRTIRFMLWGGEEQGLLGSKAYCEKHKDEMAKISAVLVHDGGTNYCAGITATPPMVKPLEAVFAPVADLDPEMPFKVREVKGLSGGGSDHASFLTANVPGFFWTQKGRANYNHTHHTQFDTYDAAIPEYQKNSAIVIAVGALGIANLPELLSRENLRAPNGGGGGRRLGVTFADDMSAEDVAADGLGAKAGLVVGDKLIKIGDQAVTDRDEIRTMLQEAPAKTKLVVSRKGKEVELPIEFPADAGPGGAIVRRLAVRFGDGLTIEVVTPGGIADQAGLQAGDRIVKVGEKTIETLADLAPALTAQTGNPKVAVMREGKEVVVTLPMGERP